MIAVTDPRQHAYIHTRTHMITVTDPRQHAYIHTCTHMITVTDPRQHAYIHTHTHDNCHWSKAARIHTHTHTHMITVTDPRQHAYIHTHTHMITVTDPRQHAYIHTCTHMITVTDPRQHAYTHTHMVCWYHMGLAFNLTESYIIIAENICHRCCSWYLTEQALCDKISTRLASQSSVRFQQEDDRQQYSAVADRGSPRWGS